MNGDTDGGSGVGSSGTPGGADASDVQEGDQSDVRARTQETQKSVRTILAQEIEEGLVELDRPTSGLFLSALAAGLDIGFGPLLMAVVLSTPSGGLAPPILDLLVASAYAVGFVFVILGRTSLFTEQTTLAVLPVLHGRARGRDLLRVWTIVYASNLVGAAVFAALVFAVGPAIDIANTAAFAEVGGVYVRYSWWATVLSGVLAGWLMGLLSWLVRATRDTISVIFVVFVVTGSIGYAHLPHSIAGTVEVLLAVIADPAITSLDYAGFLLWSTLGNVVGGVVFVALLNYSYAVRTGEEPDGVDISSAGGANVGRDAGR